MFEKIKAIFRKKPLIEHQEALDVSGASLSFAGHKFTAISPFSNEFIMSRRNKYFLDQYEMEWGILKEDILNFTVAAITRCEFPNDVKDLQGQLKALTDQLADVKTLMTQLHLVLKEDYQFKPFLKSAANVILLDDEKPTDDPMLTFDKKMELCERHSEVASFFLSLSASLIFRLKNKELITERLALLKKESRAQMKMEKALLSLISSDLFPRSSNSETQTSMSTNQA